MRRRIVVLAAASLSLSTLGFGAGNSAAGGVHGRILRIYSHHSSNWSGYVQGTLEQKGTLFHEVSASWVVPIATQHRSGQDEASATWTGIGGGCVDAACAIVDPTLIQSGTEQDVSAAGVPSYSAWFELIPLPPIIITSVSVHAGDLVQVEIKEVIPLTHVWTITMTNFSTGQSFRMTVPYLSGHLSAEWIEEAPTAVGTGGVGVAPMPTLSRVRFDLATVNGAPAGLVPDEQVVLSNSKGDVATPSDPDPDTDGFNVCVYAASCLPPATS